ncbi:hypothetical protein ACLOJK_033074 [Asimina triloba]
MPALPVPAQTKCSHIRYCRPRSFQSLNRDHREIFSGGNGNCSSGVASEDHQVAGCPSGDMLPNGAKPMNSSHPDGRVQHQARHAAPSRLNKGTALFVAPESHPQEVPHTMLHQLPVCGTCMRSPRPKLLTSFLSAHLVLPYLSVAPMLPVPSDRRSVVWF